MYCCEYSNLVEIALLCLEGRKTFMSVSHDNFFVEGKEFALLSNYKNQ